MVSKPPIFPRQELRDADGRTLAYLVSADEMGRLLAEADDLRRQAAVLRRQKDSYAEQLKQALLTLAPPPPTEGETRQAAANPGDLSAIIAELERK